MRLKHHNPPLFSSQAWSSRYWSYPLLSFHSSEVKLVDWQCRILSFVCVSMPVLSYHDLSIVCPKLSNQSQFMLLNAFWRFAMPVLVFALNDSLENLQLISVSNAGGSFTREFHLWAILKCSNVLWPRSRMQGLYRLAIVNLFFDYLMVSSIWNLKGNVIIWSNGFHQSLCRWRVWELEKWHWSLSQCLQNKCHFLRIH